MKYRDVRGAVTNSRPAVDPGRDIDPSALNPLRVDDPITMLASKFPKVRLVYLPKLYLFPMLWICLHSSPTFTNPRPPFQYLSLCCSRNAYART